MPTVGGRLFGRPNLKQLRAYAPLLVLIALCVLITIANPNFIELRNLVQVANSAAVPLTLAMGLTFIILLGSIDLSVEGSLSVAAMVTVLLATNDANANSFGWLAVIAAIAASTAMGFVTGAIQTFLRIPSFMATLGVWFIGLGISVYMLGGSAVTPDGPVDPRSRARCASLVCRSPFGWRLAAFLLACGIQYYTRLGRHIMAIGGGEDVAELSGINLRRVRIMAFGLAGFFFGIAGVLAAAQLGTFGCRSSPMAGCLPP